MSKVATTLPTMMKLSEKDATTVLKLVPMKDTLVISPEMTPRSPVTEDEIAETMVLMLFTAEPNTAVTTVITCKAFFGSPW